MQNSLIDAGPLIALFDKDDKHHQAIKGFLKNYRGKLHSTWPVLTEAQHLLDFSLQAQLDCLRWIEKGAVQLHPFETLVLSDLIQLTEKYHNVPMDLADATLVLLAQQLNIHQIITLDADYYIYRIGRRKSFEYLFQT